MYILSTNEITIRLPSVYSKKIWVVPIVKRQGIEIELKRKDPKASTKLIFVDIDISFL